MIQLKSGGIAVAYMSEYRAVVAVRYENNILVSVLYRANDRYSCDRITSLVELIDGRIAATCDGDIYIWQL
jgi:hypothetical protein